MMNKTIAALVMIAFMGGPASAQFSVVDAITTNRSATITTGNTFQTVLAKQQLRSLTIQNNNATDNCWVEFGVGITAGNASSAKAIMLSPGQAFTRYFPYVPFDEIEGTCA